MLLHVVYYAPTSSTFSSRGSTQFQDKAGKTGKSEGMIRMERSFTFQVFAWASTSGVLFCKTGNAREKLHTAGYQLYLLEKHIKLQIRQRRASGSWRVKWCKMNKKCGTAGKSHKLKYWAVKRWGSKSKVASGDAKRYSKSQMSLPSNAASKYLILKNIKLCLQLHTLHGESYHRNSLNVT